MRLLLRDSATLLAMNYRVTVILVLDITLAITTSNYARPSTSSTLRGLYCNTDSSTRSLFVVSVATFPPFPLTRFFYFIFTNSSILSHYIDI
jgi:hypothetical protein